MLASLVLPVHFLPLVTFDIFFNPVFFESNDHRPHDITEGHAASLCLVLAGALHPARVPSLAHQVRPDEENVSASK